MAKLFEGRALAAVPATIDGVVGILWAVAGRPRVVWPVAVRDGAIVAIDKIADPEHLARLDIVEVP